MKRRIQNDRKKRKIKYQCMTVIAYDEKNRMDNSKICS